MVGTFVRLKLRLLRNGLSIGQGAVLFGIGAFGAGVLALIGFGTLAAAASASVTIVVTPTQAGPLSNTVSVSGSPTDSTPANNAATATTTVIAATALSFGTQPGSEHLADLAGASRRALPGAARLHGLPTLPRNPLALRPARADEALPRVPFLARRVLIHVPAGRVARGSSRVARPECSTGGETLVLMRVYR